MCVCLIIGKIGVTYAFTYFNLNLLIICSLVFNNHIVVVFNECRHSHLCRDAGQGERVGSALRSRPSGHTYTDPD